MAPMLAQMAVMASSSEVVFSAEQIATLRNKFDDLRERFVVSMGSLSDAEAAALDSYNVYQGLLND